MFRQEPSKKIETIIANLEKLGKAIVAIKGESFSGNFLGSVSLEHDGGDRVLKISGCGCHIHVKWNDVKNVIVDEQDVGYGPEAVIKLIDSNQSSVVYFFYPQHTKEKLTNAITLSPL